MLSRSGVVAANQLSDALASATMAASGWLNLVGDRRGQLAKGRHAGYVRELRLGLLQRFRSPGVSSEVASDRERGFDPLGVRPQRE